MKKKRILSVVLAVLLVLPCILTGSAVESEQGYYTYAIGSRPFLADNFEELVAASDVMLIGQVVAQYPEVRHDLVFTYSRVQVSEVIDGTVVGNQTQIEVLQTGGTANGITSPALADEPLMNIGENYLLCLTFSPADEQYQAYYLPTGGGQGIISFSDMASAETTTTQSSVAGTIAAGDAGLAQVISRAEVVFDNGEYGCCQPMGGLYGDEYTNGHWERSVLEYVIDISATHTFEAYADCAITQWNLNDYVYLTDPITATGGEILVTPAAFGQTGWEAQTMYNIGGASYGTTGDYPRGIYQHVLIQANTSIYAQSNSTWIEILCHEAGHAIGLGHVNPRDDSNSVMVADTLTRTADSPSTRDISLVNNVYDSVSFIENQ